MTVWREGCADPKAGFSAKQYPGWRAVYPRSPRGRELLAARVGQLVIQGLLCKGASADRWKDRMQISNWPPNSVIATTRNSPGLISIIRGDRNGCSWAAREAASVGTCRSLRPKAGVLGTSADGKRLREESARSGRGVLRAKQSLIDACRQKRPSAACD